MDKKTCLEVIAGYDEDWESISSIIDDDSLTPSEKVSEISEIVQDEEDEDEPDEIEEGD
jgi:hypothetical protein